MRGATALLLLAAALAAPAAGGEPEKKPVAKPVKLHWHMPRQINTGSLGDLRYGTVPFDVVRVKLRLCVSVISGGRGQAQFFGRSPEGLWVELAGSTEARQISRWANLGDRVVAVIGGQNGIQATVIAPDAAKDKKVQTFDILMPEDPKEPWGRRRGRVNVLGLDLAAADGKLFALYSRSSYDASGRQRSDVGVCTSADGGKTWSKPNVLAKSDGSSSQGRRLAIWAGARNLHVLYAPLGSGSAKLKHSTSADAGKTWKDAPELPAPAEGKQLFAVRVFKDGPEVYLVGTESSSGGGAWVYRSSDGGTKWAKPLAIGSVKLTSAGSDALSGCHLAVGKKLLAFGNGWVKGKYHRSAGRSRYTYSAKGALLLSRDDGASWHVETFTAGLKGSVFCPLAAPSPGGGLDLVFGWTGKGGQSPAFLYRRATLRPPPGQDAAMKALLAKHIENLAAVDYRARERAAAALRGMGLAALPALRKAATDKDTERSLTAEDLLKKMTPPWWKGP